jgi:hypothetical protein
MNDSLTFDLALRKARTEAYGVTEIRAGVTLSLLVHH